MVLTRVIDLGVMNCRALYKMAGVEYTMAQMKRILAYGLAARAVRAERLPPTVNVVQTGELLNLESERVSRLDGKFHCWDIFEGGRRRCQVHRSKRCLTKKYCSTCGQVPLCNAEAWRRYHTMYDCQI